MTALTPALRELIEAGPMAHLTTLNRDGSPQVTVIWIGLDGDQIVSGHRALRQKLKNIQRDPRVVLSFEGPRDHEAFLQEYAVVKATATVEPSDQSWQLLDRLAKVYVTPQTTFPGEPGEGYIVRYEIERVTGVGPWADKAWH